MQTQLFLAAGESQPFHILNNRDFFPRNLELRMHEGDRDTLLFVVCDSTDAAELWPKIVHAMQALGYSLDEEIMQVLGTFNCAPMELKAVRAITPPPHWTASFVQHTSHHFAVVYHVPVKEYKWTQWIDLHSKIRHAMAHAEGVACSPGRRQTMMRESDFAEGFSIVR